MHYKTAFITGGSGGIGRHLAERLASRGTEVVVAARNATLLADIVDRIRDAGGRARFYELDVTNPEEVVRVLHLVDDELDGIDLVIANAGVSHHAWSGNLTWTDCAPVIGTNVSGAVATLTALLPRMVARKRGHLVGISSLAQYRGFPQSAAYSASKAFLSTFLEALRVDLRGTSVYVSDIRPGFVRTGMTTKHDHPRPFIMEAESAVDRIVEAIERRDAVFSFPWPFATLVRSTRLLPRALYDWGAVRARFGRKRSRV